MPRDLSHLRELDKERAAREEARSLLALEATGCGGPCSALCGSVEDVVLVPPEMRDRLIAFVERYPEERANISEAMRFRIRVAKHVNKMRRAA